MIHPAANHQGDWASLRPMDYVRFRQSGRDGSSCSGQGYVERMEGGTYWVRRGSHLVPITPGFGATLERVP